MINIFDTETFTSYWSNPPQTEAISILAMGSPTNVKLLYECEYIGISGSSYAANIP